jgi:hypothetical protein
MGSETALMPRVSGSMSGHSHTLTVGVHGISTVHEMPFQIFCLQHPEQVDHAEKAERSGALLRERRRRLVVIAAAVGPPLWERF